MSVSGPLSGIRFTGLASGLDVESIVSQLMTLESVSVRRLQTQQAQLQARQGIYSQFKTTLLSLNSAASALTFPSAYNPVKATSSDETIAKVTASETAQVGTYALTVNRLAAKHKVTTAAQADTSTALGQAGTFVVNGKAVKVEATDSLTAIASKINSTGSGVTASILDGGAGQAFLSLTASSSGLSTKVQLADLSGSVAGNLGLTSGAASIRELVDADTVRSYGLSSSSTVLADVIGQTASGTFTVGGQTVSIDFSSDTLEDVANKINLASGGATATVVDATIGGKSVKKLELSGASIPAGLVDTDGLLQALGIYQKGFANELVAAQDAEVEIDNVTLTSESNSVTTAIPGSTITLVKTGSATLDFNRNDDQIKDKVKAFQTAYNDVVEYIRANSRFDDETFESGPLFGDQTVAQVESAMSNVVFQNLGTGSIANLSSLGFSFDSDGKLQLDEARLSSAIASDVTSVKNLLSSTGTATGTGLSFVSATNKTLVGGSYAVDITQAAIKANWLGAAAQTLPNAGGEILSFSGAYIGSSQVDVYIPAGSTQSDLVLQINSDSRLKDLVQASIEGGLLKIESKRFGSVGDFTVQSNLSAGSDNSGIGKDEAVHTAGVDVAGTINGEPATGNGQFLTGNATNANTSGLQVMYTGTATGLIGTVGYTRGVAASLSSMMEGYTDSVNGLMTSADQAFTSQIDDIDDRIAQIQINLQLREATLRAKFTAMENALARLNAQSGQLAAILS